MYDFLLYTDGSGWADCPVKAGGWAARLVSKSKAVHDVSGSMAPTDVFEMEMFAYAMGLKLAYELSSDPLSMSVPKVYWYTDSQSLFERMKKIEGNNNPKRPVEFMIMSMSARVEVMMNNVPRDVDNIHFKHVDREASANRTLLSDYLTQCR